MTSITTTLAAAAAGAGAVLLLLARRRRRSSQGGEAASPRRAGLPPFSDTPLPAEGYDEHLAQDRVIRKCETVLRRRTSHMVIVVERSTNAHNYTAIVRTAEALGIQHFYVISPPSLDISGRYKRRKDPFPEDRRLLEQHIVFARNASKWVSLRNFETTAECVEALREEGRDIWVTDLSQKAWNLDDLLGAESPSHQAPLPRMAICFGTENAGASQELLDAADRRVYLPLHGFADSLNLSVAAALVVQRLLLADPSMIGRMDEAERNSLRTAWYPSIARNDEDRERYARMAELENSGQHSVAPFLGLRRPLQHRTPHVSRTMRRKKRQEQLEAAAAARREREAAKQSGGKSGAGAEGSS